jgi:hypothetical protein
VIWVNIDLPLKTCTIHTNNCLYINNMKGSLYKGINLLKRDGGWISFENIEEANQFCLDQYVTFKLVNHC